MLATIHFHYLLRFFVPFLLLLCCLPHVVISDDESNSTSTAFYNEFQESEEESVYNETNVDEAYYRNLQRVTACRCEAYFEDFYTRRRLSDEARILQVVYPYDYTDAYQATDGYFVVEGVKVVDCSVLNSKTSTVQQILRGMKRGNPKKPARKNGGGGVGKNRPITSQIITRFANGGKDVENRRRKLIEASSDISANNDAENSLTKPEGSEESKKTLRLSDGELLLSPRISRRSSVVDNRADVRQRKTMSSKGGKGYYYGNYYDYGYSSYGYGSRNTHGYGKGKGVYYGSYYGKGKGGYYDYNYDPPDTNIFYYYIKPDPEPVVENHYQIVVGKGSSSSKGKGYNGKGKGDDYDYYYYYYDDAGDDPQPPPPPRPAPAPAPAPDTPDDDSYFLPDEFRCPSDLAPLAALARRNTNCDFKVQKGRVKPFCKK